MSEADDGDRAVARSLEWREPMPSDPRRIPFVGLNRELGALATRRRLPHWTQSGVTYFCTFRLADALPVSRIHKWHEERRIWLSHHPGPWDADTSRQFMARFPIRMERWLDAGMGGCHLRRRDIRETIERSLRRFDGIRHDLDAFVLMPNHVHLLITPRHSHQLATLLKGIKGTSARECNRILGLSGKPFWMNEGYDHIVRNLRELHAFRGYIARNPVKAGLRPEEYTLVSNHILTGDTA